MAEAVEDIDRGWNKIKANAKKAAGNPMVVDVGIIGNKAAEAHGKGEFTNVDVGTFHEFGTKTIPERSFIRSTIDERRPDILKLFERIAKGILDGKIKPEKDFGLVGLKVVSWIKAKIRKGIAPPLMPATIKAKGSSKPLIDKGELMGSITHVVRKQHEGDK